MVIKEKRLYQRGFFWEEWGPANVWLNKYALLYRSGNNNLLSRLNSKHVICTEVYISEGINIDKQTNEFKTYSW